MKRIIFILVLLLLPTLVYATTTVDATGPTFSYLESSTGKIATNLQAIGIKLFFALTMLQLVITGYGQIASGEIEATIGKFAKALIWISFCLYLMLNHTASDFVGNTIQYFLDHAVGWAASGNGTTTKFDASGIFGMGMTTIGDAIAAIGNAAKPTANNTGFFSYFAAVAAISSVGLVSIVYGVVMMLILIVIVLVTCGYVALKIFMIKIEAALILAILPLSISFLGLNALRDQGFAPFKSMLALIYRIVILGAIVGGMTSIAEDLRLYAIQLNSGNQLGALGTAANVLEIYVTTAFGFVMLLFLAHKSDSIAASLANGSANLGSGDMAGAVMAGMAAGAAIATGGASVAAGGANAAKSMGDVMKGLSGGGGTVSNASSKGVGKTPDPAPAKPSASMGESGSKSSGAPQRDPAASTPANEGSSSSSPASASPGSSTASSPSPSATESASSPTGTSVPASSAVPGSGSGTNTGSSPDSPSSSAPPSNGSGANAAIGAAPESGMEKKLGELVSALSAPKKASFADKMKDVGQHVAQEKAATHVSINTNHHE